MKGKATKQKEGISREDFTAKYAKHHFDHSAYSHQEAQDSEEQLGLKENDEENGDILTFKKTRKAFIPEYTCGTVLFLLFLSSPFFNVPFPSIVQRGILGISILAFSYAELSRKLSSYEITPEKVIITQGIIRQNKKNVHFHPLGYVPDINVRQGLLQRILDYGDVFIEGAGQNQLEIKDVNQPHKIMKIIEERIEKNRTLSSKRRV